MTVADFREHLFMPAILPKYLLSWPSCCGTIKLRFNAGPAHRSAG
jgi:hypothetical protein